MLCLWLNFIPQSINKDNLISGFRNEFKVIKEAEIKITRNAFHNLRVQFQSLLPMGRYCSGYSSCLFLLIADDISEIKNYVNRYLPERELVQPATNFFYISVDKIETDRLKKVIFNPNSLHFLKYGKPFKYKKAWNLCMDFKQTIEKAGESLDDYIVETSMVLAMYGVRDACDLDYSTNSNKEMHFADEQIEKHVFGVQNL